MFRFANPAYLYVLWLLPLFAAAYWLAYRRKRQQLNLLIAAGLQLEMTGQKSFLKESVRAMLFIAALGLGVLALARPQLGSRMEEVKQIGIDVYICLDVSASMMAEDLRPNRLEKAKNEISALIRRLQGDRIGLIIFAGQSYIQFPLTSDYSAASLFLSAVDVNSIPVQGTAVASAIDLAVTSFDKNSPTKKVIVVITDGEDHQGDIKESVQKALDAEIRIFTIGMGSPQGAPIPVYGPAGNQLGYKQDRDGNIVLTKLDESVLQQLAAGTGGKYYLSTSYQDELELIYKDLAAIDKSEYGAKRITDYEDKYYYFLVPALLLLLLEFFISERRSLSVVSFMKKYGFSGGR